LSTKRRFTGAFSQFVGLYLRYQSKGPNSAKFPYPEELAPGPPWSHITKGCLERSAAETFAPYSHQNVCAPSRIVTYPQLSSGIICLLCAEARARAAASSSA